MVMNRAAGDLIPSADRFHRLLGARRSDVSPLAKLLRTLLGIEAKMNQYAQGERFIAEIERVGGPRCIDLCWQAPENLPSMDEIRDPARWLRRHGLSRAA